MFSLKSLSSLVLLLLVVSLGSGCENSPQQDEIQRSQEDLDRIRKEMDESNRRMEESLQESRSARSKAETERLMGSIDQLNGQTTALKILNLSFECVNMGGGLAAIKKDCPAAKDFDWSKLTQEKRDKIHSTLLELQSSLPGIKARPNALSGFNMMGGSIDLAIRLTDEYLMYYEQWLLKPQSFKAQ